MTRQRIENKRNSMHHGVSRAHISRCAPLISGKDMALADPYDDLVMDHIKHARNYRVLADASHQAQGSNPLCGDELVIYLSTKHERIVDIAFQCTCCGISMASASIMSEQVKGKLTSEAKSLLGKFVAI